MIECVWNAISKRAKQMNTSTPVGGLREAEESQKGLAVEGEQIVSQEMHQLIKEVHELEMVVGKLLIRPLLSVNHAAYFTCESWKYFFTRSGDFSSVCMCSVAAAFSLALVRTGTLVEMACFKSAFSRSSGFSSGL